MSAIILLDTSIYLNVLDVPGFNQKAGKIRQEITDCFAEGDSFLLPLATVWETGNHITRLADGQQRRDYTQKFIDDIVKAFDGQAPYQATHFPERGEFVHWLKEFPDKAMRKISLADHTIIKEWQRNCDLNPARRVRIWSLDEDLAGYDRQP